MLFSTNIVNTLLAEWDYRKDPEESI